MVAGLHRTIILTLIVVVAATIRLAAQSRIEPILVGATFGYGGGVQVGEIPVYAGSAECGSFRSGYLYGPDIGLRCDLPNVLRNEYGLSMSLLWQHTRGQMQTEPLGAQRVVDPRTSELITLNRAYILQRVGDAIVLDMAATWSPGTLWTFGAGVSAAVPVGFSVTQIDTVMAPQNFAFGDGLRSQIMTGGTVLPERMISFGPVVTAAARFPIGGGFTVMPGAGVRFDITSIVQGVPLRDLRADATVSLLLDLTHILPNGQRLPIRQLSLHPLHRHQHRCSLHP